MGEDLSAVEKKALLYFSGIKALEKNIFEKVLVDFEDKTDLDIEAEYNDENIIFVILFFLIVVLTNSSDEVRKIVLKCKQEEMEDMMIPEDDVRRYIGNFNDNFKRISMIFLDINKEASGNDEIFQKLITEKFADIILEEINVNNAKDEIKSGLISELNRALMVGFEFK